MNLCMGMCVLGCCMGVQQCMVEVHQKHAAIALVLLSRTAKAATSSLASISGGHADCIHRHSGNQPEAGHTAQGSKAVRGTTRVLLHAVVRVWSRQGRNGPEA